MVTAQGVRAVSAPARRAGESGSAYIRRLEIDGWLSAEAVPLRGTPRTARSRWRRRPRAATHCALPGGWLPAVCAAATPLSSLRPRNRIARRRSQPTHMHPAEPRSLLALEGRELPRRWAAPFRVVPGTCGWSSG